MVVLSFFAPPKLRGVYSNFRSLPSWSKYYGSSVRHVAGSRTCNKGIIGKRTSSPKSIEARRLAPCRSPLRRNYENPRNHDTLVALVAIGITSFFAYRYEGRRQTADTCPFCDRMIHSVTAYRLKVDGRDVTACCPRCGMHAMLNREQGKPGEAWATDVNTGQTVGSKIRHVRQGGDVQYCMHDSQPVMREPNGVSVREYDRCLPTWPHSELRRKRKFTKSSMAGAY